MEASVLCLGSLALVGTGIAIAVGTRIVLDLWLQAQQTRLALAVQRLDVEERRLDLDRARLRITQEVRPDEYGVYPLLWDGSRALDPNRGVVFDISGGVQALTPGLVQPEQLARLLRAGGGWPGSAAARSLLETPPVVSLPGKVNLAELIDGQPSVRSLVLGVAVNGNEPETVMASMEDLVHVAVGGSSGWGKSVFLRALAYQLALSTDPVDLALVDLEGATFAPLARCDRLLWPVADTEGDALAIFQELTGELTRRKELFGQYPGVDKLSAYNAAARADGEPLSPVVCLIDEATALLEDKGVESALRTLTLRARKYGLWVVLGGQDWKASSIDTAIRNQLSTRVQFKAKSASQSRVLLDASGAEDLTEKGRALAWLPGRDLLEMQAPYIGHREVLAAVAGLGPRHPRLVAGGEDARVARIQALAGQGLSKRQICLEVFGYTGGAAYTTVSQVLEAGTTTTPHSGTAAGGYLTVVK